MKVLSIVTLDQEHSGPPSSEEMDGRSTVTAGPFAETKEVVGGYAILEVLDRADAEAWTNRFLDIIGDAPCYVREVFSPPM